jgi:hypothetical protein
MNWFITILSKEARRRRFNPGDSVRFLTSPRKGKGSTVLMPDFQRGKVRDYNRTTNRYHVETAVDDLIHEHEVHPRNLLADGVVPQARAPEPVAIQEGGI